MTSEYNICDSNLYWFRLFVQNFRILGFANLLKFRKYAFFFFKRFMIEIDKSFFIIVIIIAFVKYYSYFCDFCCCWLPVYIYCCFFVVVEIWSILKVKVIFFSNWALTLIFVWFCVLFQPKIKINSNNENECVFGCKDLYMFFLW
jgi:hypothetical protein